MNTSTAPASSRRPLDRARCLLAVVGLGVAACASGSSTTTPARGERVLGRARHERPRRRARGRRPGRGGDLAHCFAIVGVSR